LYLFASHKLHARVEVAVSEHFNVLNNIVWVSNGATTKRADRTLLRSYLPSTEHVIFAEQYGADKPYQNALIDGNSTYWGACETLKVSIFGDYLQNEFSKAGVTRREIAELFPSKSGNLTGCVSNWLLGYNIPTELQYHTMKKHLGKCGGLYLRREYEDLRREYEDLRREYEDLRREYEDLRRPFYLDNAGGHETNVWTFDPVFTDRRHPTQKPVEMFEHIMNVSTRPGDLVLDPCVGSGTTAVAAMKTDRRYICGDITREYVAIARRRVQNADYTKAKVLDNGTKQLSLFESA
jgi:site-specific DNA-methyltransferase (adenine-specific)